MVPNDKWVSKIGIGSVQFGMPYGISNTRGQTSPSEVKLILDLAREVGIDVIDTAFAYGNAEDVLGKNDLSGFDIVSKFKGDAPLEQLEKTFARLNVTSIYGYLAHWPKDLIDFGHCWSDLQKAKADGRVKKIGYSLNEPEEYRLLSAKGFKPDLIQAPYNILDHRFETIMKELKETGCEIHTRSTFLQGLFFMEPNSLPSFFDDVKPMLEVLQKSPANIVAAVMKFVLEKPFVDKIILGVNDVIQLKENLAVKTSSIDRLSVPSYVSEDILMPWKWPKK